MYCIYKATNIINGKLYIGKTNNFEKRKREHIFTPSNHLFYRALKKYGTENFSWEIVESDIETYEASNEKERYWIKHFNSYFRREGSHGYNMTHGGDGGSDWNLKKVAAYSKDGYFLNEFDSLSECAKHYGISGSSCISRVCGKNLTCSGMMFKLCDTECPSEKIEPYRVLPSSRCKPVCQLDLMGNLIKRYSSIAEAENLGFAHTGILGCIKGRYKKSNGFQWCYENELSEKVGIPAERAECYGTDRIVQCSIGGEIVAEYNNCLEAAENCGIKTHKIIHKALSSETHFSQGYKWYKKSELSI